MRSTAFFTLFLSLALTLSVPAKEPASTRIQALGGAGVAFPDEPASLYWNPAGLYYQNRLSLDVTLKMDRLKWPSVWGVTYLNYGRAMQRGAGIGVYRQVVPGDSSGSAGGNALAVLVTTAYRTPWIGLPLGLSFKYINERWEDLKRQNYFTADVGTMLKFGSLYLGISFQSVTQPESRVYPYRVLTGLSWRPFQRLALLGQAGMQTWDEVENWKTGDLRLGMEILPGKSLSLQGGWAQLPGEKYWTFGLGYEFDGGRARVQLGYHRHPTAEMDDSVFLGYIFTP